jgi:hypothetical protein
MAGRLPDCGGDAAFAGRLACLGIAAGAQKSWRDYKRPPLRKAPPDAQSSVLLLNRAASREAALEQLAAVLGVSQPRPLRIVETPFEPVAIRYEWLAHIVEEARDARERFANYILATLENPYEIWIVANDDGKYRKQYVGIFTGDENVMVVVRESNDGTLDVPEILLWNAMQANDKAVNRHRAGGLVYGK